MNIKIVIASIIIVAALIFGAVSFVETNVEYTDFQSAMSSNKKVQVKGEWLKEKEYGYDAGKNEFSFFMKDDNKQKMKVVLKGAKPNNFEIATSIVVKGRFRDEYFYASECLTKCPSKYEGDAETMKKTL